MYTTINTSKSLQARVHWTNSDQTQSLSILGFLSARITKMKKHQIVSLLSLVFLISDKSDEIVKLEQNILVFKTQARYLRFSKLKMFRGLQVCIFFSDNMTFTKHQIVSLLSLVFLSPSSRGWTESWSVSTQLIGN